jgi:sugar O-acyltransferase (sialic acid O-acetyltransferase NeuD family)
VKSVLLVGGGGHCRSCIDVIEAEGELEVAGIVERSDSSSSVVVNYPTLGTDVDLPRLLEQYPLALITVGQITNAEPRMRLFRTVIELGASAPVVVSPRAYVSRRAYLGDGVIVLHGAVVNTGASVGANCIINSLALVEHDVSVAPHCHVSTGARLNGGVVVGEGSFIGSGAVIMQGVRIGAGSIVGAGVTVGKDIPENSLVRGSA